MERSGIDAKITSIEARLHKIESALKIKTVSEKTAQNTSTCYDNPFYNKTFPSVNDDGSDCAKSANVGGFLGFVAIICFILAAGFIIKLSIDSGWLTPARQIGLSALLGCALVVSGLFLLGSDREYAGYLPAAGVVVFLASIFAAHSYYRLMEYDTALYMVAAVTAFCIWLYTQIKSEIYTIIAALGAYSVPIVSDLSSTTVFTVYYYLTCSLAFASLSVIVRSRTLAVVASYSAIILTFVSGSGIVKEEVLAAALVAHFAMFSVGTLVYSLRTKSPLTSEEASSFLPVLLIFYAEEYFILSGLSPWLAPWISLAFAVFIIALYLAAKEYFLKGLNSGHVVNTFVSIILFHSVYLEILPEEVKPWAAVAVVFVALFLFYRGTGFLKAYRNKSLSFSAIAAAAIFLIEYASLVMVFVQGNSDINLFLAGIFMAIGLWGTVFVMPKVELEGVKQGNLLLLAAHIVSVSWLYGLATKVGSLAVSAAWLFYAVVIICLAFLRKDKDIANSALIVLGLAAVKALIYDAVGAPTIVRILCLLLTGAVLYGCGLAVRKAALWGNAKVS